jgi:hypothetical protein
LNEEGKCVSIKDTLELTTWNVRDLTNKGLELTEEL